jgi:hypothetical protein
VSHPANLPQHLRSDTDFFKHATSTERPIPGFAVQQAEAADRAGACPLPIEGTTADALGVKSAGDVIVLRSTDLELHARLQLSAACIRSEIARRRGEAADNAQTLRDRAAEGDDAAARHERRAEQCQAAAVRLHEQLPPDAAERIADLVRQEVAAREAAKTIRQVAADLRGRVTADKAKAAEDAARVGGEILSELAACRRGDRDAMTAVVGPAGPEIWKAMKVIGDRLIGVKDADFKVLAAF